MSLPTFADSMCRAFASRVRSSPAMVLMREEGFTGSTSRMMRRISS